jgi:hypothetical protein
MSSASAGKLRRDETNSSAIEMLVSCYIYEKGTLNTINALVEIVAKLVNCPLAELLFGIEFA